MRVRDYYEATAPESEEGGYVNFAGADDQGRVQANYGANYDRLVEVKRVYDPDNLFHLNQNIVPKADRGSGPGAAVCVLVHRSDRNEPFKPGTP